MKTFLFYRDRDFDPDEPLPESEAALTQDLELTVLFNAMAGGDRFLFDMARAALLQGIKGDLDTIRYRQAILQDCLKNAAVIRELYTLALEAIEPARKEHWGLTSRYPGSILSSSVRAMQVLVEALRKLRSTCDQHAAEFDSEGFRRFIAMLDHELSDAYFAEIEAHLQLLKFREGVLVSAELSEGGKDIHHVLRRPQKRDLNWLLRLVTSGPPSYTYVLHPRDEAGGQILQELSGRGVNLAANALAQSCEHILSFFRTLKAELAFYVGALHLSEELARLGISIAFPDPVPADALCFSCRGLIDICLALTMGGRVVGNGVAADGKRLIVVTGANRGGKSTFLRSVGLAQLMMQAGLFVAAEAFSTGVSDGLFTHFKREEDATMTSGKFDEELARMSAIADHVTPGALMLFNESFAATNEREGAEIASQIVAALLEAGVRVFFVTHMYTLAHGFEMKGPEETHFLRAERRDDGSRTFKLIAAPPLQTSFGRDLYESIFGAESRQSETDEPKERAAATAGRCSA